MFEKIKRFFRMKLYTVNHIKAVCDKGVITPEQFTEITGEEY